MAYRKACNLDELWEGEMIEVDVADRSVLLVHLDGGEVRAFQAACPHQDIPLAEGKLDGRALICRAHQWSFDAGSGLGINPADCRLAVYPVRIDGDDVMVEIDGIEPCFART